MTIISATCVCASCIEVVDHILCTNYGCESAKHHHNQKGNHLSHGCFGVGSFAQIIQYIIKKASPKNKAKPSKNKVKVNKFDYVENLDFFF